MKFKPVKNKAKVKDDFKFLTEEIIKATTNQKDDNLPLLENLFDFCQSEGRVHPFGIRYENGPFRVIKKHKDFIMYIFPPNQCILGAADDPLETKRERLLTHIFWAFKKGLIFEFNRELLKLPEKEWGRAFDNQEWEWEFDNLRTFSIYEISNVYDRLEREANEEYRKK